MRRAAALAVLAALCLLASACSGGGDTPTTPRADGPRLPFPPVAQEPATAPEPRDEPAGTVVDVGPGPEGVAVDPETGIAAVGLRDGRLALVDARSGEVVRRVRLASAPRHVQLARPGGPFLVPSEEADALAVIDPRTGEGPVVRVGDHPHDAAMLADGTIVVGDEFGSTATLVRGDRVVRTVGVDVQPGGVVALGEEAAVISVRAYTIALLDRRGRETAPSQSAGYGPSHGVADAEGRVYVADTRGDGVSVFETRPRLRFVARVPVAGSPYGLAIDRRRGRLWVTAVGRNALVEVSTGDEPAVRRTLPTVRQPNTVGVDERTGRVLVTSRTDGTLQLIDP